MPEVGYDLWFFPDSVDFGETTARRWLVAGLPPETIFFKAVYLNRTDQDSMGAARQRIATRERGH